uniref:Uncharacterized protein n=1 Tax=Ursus americanus TaxID=9643 RepID=A0A452QII6_URSAM
PRAWPVSPQRVQARVQLREQRAPGSGPVQGNVPVRLQVRAGPRSPGARGGRGPAKRVRLPASPRKDAVSVVDTYQYPDLEDAFSREPFVVKFSAPGSAAGEFVLIPLHAAPHRAVSEIDALYDVYLDVIDKWGTDVSPVPVPVPCARAGGWRCPCGRGVRGRARAQPRLRGPRRTCCSWATSTLTATTCGSATGRLSACAAARSSSGSSPTALTPPWATRTAPTTASWRAAPACAGASSPSRPPCTTSRRSSAWTRLRRVRAGKAGEGRSHTPPRASASEQSALRGWVLAERIAWDGGRRPWPLLGWGLQSGPQPTCRLRSGSWSPSGLHPWPKRGCGQWSFSTVESQDRLPGGAAQAPPLSLQALAISDHFPVEVTLKSH